MSFIVTYPNALRTFETRDEAVSFAKGLRMPRTLEILRLVYEGEIGPMPPVPPPPPPETPPPSGSTDLDAEVARAA